MRNLPDDGSVLAFRILGVTSAAKAYTVLGRMVSMDCGDILAADPRAQSAPPIRAIYLRAAAHPIRRLPRPGVDKPG